MDLTLESQLSITFLQMNPRSYTILQDLISQKGKDFQEIILKKTIEHPVCLKFSPSKSFKETFLRTAIKKIESLGIEVDERIYLHFVETMQAPAKPFHYKTYTLPNNDQISIKEGAYLISNGTTGLSTWEASDALIEFCTEKKEEFKHRKILELGSGLGYAGFMIIKKVQPASYTFSDHHYQVMQYLENNIRTNLQDEDESSEGPPFKWNNTNVSLINLDWMDPRQIPEVDTVIASDILFDTDLIPSIVSILCAILNNPSAQAYIAATIRNEKTFTFFKEETRKNGLVWEIVKEVTDQKQSKIQVLSISKMV